jgi:hypothetical protein
VPRPIPRAAPVTNAVLPRSFIRFEAPVGIAVARRRGYPIRIARLQASAIPASRVIGVPPGVDRPASRVQSDSVGSCAVAGSGIRYQGASRWRLADAARGEPEAENPVRRAWWGEGRRTPEHSKRCGDASGPQCGFAALTVSGGADTACPFVKRRRSGSRCRASTRRLSGAWPGSS